MWQTVVYTRLAAILLQRGEWKPVAIIGDYFLCFFYPGQPGHGW